MVPTHDPIIEDAAVHAVKSIQQMSNSLIPYELFEVLSAKAKVGLCSRYVFLFFHHSFHLLGFSKL